MDYDTDVLVRIIIKKDKRRVSYLTMRNSATDIPTLAIAVSKKKPYLECCNRCKTSKSYINRWNRIFK